MFSKKVFLPILIIGLFAAELNAQEAIIFKVKFQPEKTYTTTLTTTSNSEITFSSEDPLPESLQQPMKMDGKTKVVTETVTEGKEEDGSFPATIHYRDGQNNMTVNGQNMSQPFPFTGTTIKGRYNTENIFILDTIIGGKATDEMKQTLSSMLETIQKTIQFPDYALKAGDSFETETPMEIPIPGMNPIMIKIKMNYTLKEISGGKALMDFVQQITLDSSQEQFNIEASGEGTGSSVYDIEGQFLSSYQSELPMDLSFQVNDQLSANMKVTTQSETTVTLE